MRSLRLSDIGHRINAYLIFLVIFAVTVPFLVNGVNAVFSINTLYKQEIDSLGQTIVQSIAVNSEIFIDSAVDVLKDVAAIKQFFLVDDPVRIRNFLAVVSAAHPEFESISCLNPDGIQIASFPENKNLDGLDLSDFDYAHPAPGIPRISESFVSVSDGQAVISISFRLGEKDMIVKGDIKLSQLSRFISRSISKDWSAQLVEQNGTVIADQDNNRIQTRMNIGTADRNNQTDRIGFNQKNHYAFSQKIEKCGWTAIASCNPESLSTAVIKFRNFALMLAVITYAVLSLVTFRMTRKILGDINLMHIGVTAVRERRYLDLPGNPTFVEFRELIAGLRQMGLVIQTREAELEAANEQLKSSNAELDDFAYIASHDLKEPLRGIRNYADFLEEDYADRLDADGKMYLERMQRLAERLGSLIDRLLAYSRLGSDSLPIETVDTDAVLDEIAEDLGPWLAEKNVVLCRPYRLPAIPANSLRLGEVFQNLITNAAKYNDKEQKWVEVGYNDTGGGPVFYVRDNGIGIPEHHRENVFRIFKRLHEAGKYGAGTGAGLTIVKRIIDRHGGRIWLESIPGKGTTFYFNLSKRKQ